MKTIQGVLVFMNFSLFSPAEKETGSSLQTPQNLALTKILHKFRKTSTTSGRSAVAIS